MAAKGPIHLHRSNRTEVLAAALAEILRRDPLGPMEQECIVVQGPGMQRWLSIELASALGVWANARFPFPRHLIDVAMRGVLGLGGDEGSVLQPGPLLWAVARELEALQGSPEFAEIRNYLDSAKRSEGDSAAFDGQGRERKRFQLAERVAKVLERYTIYRPELLAEWESGNGQGWQPALWRALTQRHDKQHPGAMLTRFLAELGSSSAPIEGVPRRVCLFGISSLPPIYMRVLSALAQRTTVHLFVLSPSREYWADLRRRGRSAEPELEEGNALLASLGRLSGDFQQVLEDNAEYQETGIDLYREPDLARGMLATLQSDILDLRNRGSRRGADSDDERAPEALPIAADDNSISIHSCHSPMREVEVIHDQIVAMLEADPALQARDVVVMTPDIESYAPLIDAVFTSESNDRPRIPYRIADRSDRSTFPVLQAYSKILATLSGRMGASEVLDLLALEVISARYELDEDGLAQIKTWVAEAGVRWGVDAEHRAAVGQPALVENTWQFGFDRLLLGYAMQGEQHDLFAGVLPYDDVEGNHTQVLGRLLDFTSALFRFREQVASPTSLARWSSMLSALLATMVQVNEGNLGEHRLVRDCIEGLVADAALAGFAEDLSFETIRDALEKRWTEGGNARGFLSGGVTFCQLMPMRSIPFEVVCVLGMSDGAFPRSVHPLAFDEIAKAPKVGDRTPRDDDRYLFLEAILSARKALVISYVGRSIRSNALLPPSVLVGELIEVLCDSFRVSAGSVVDRVVVQHALQPFSPNYFDASKDARLFSYSQAYGKGAESLGGPKRTPEKFLAAPLQLEEGVEREVSLTQLVRFFANPAKYLLQQRLGLFLDDEDEIVQDREPMALGHLDGYRVGEELLARLLEGQSAAAAYASVKAAGALPLGAVGKVDYDDLQGAVSLLSACAKQYVQEPGLESLNLDRTIAGTRLVGVLSQLWPQGRIHVAYQRLGRSGEFGEWIRHLALCLIAPAGYGKQTVLIGRAGKADGMQVVTFAEVANAEQELAHLLQLYWAGQVAPLPFFAKTAREFVQRLDGVALAELSDEQYQKARQSAIKAFEGSEHNQFAEGLDAYVAQIYAGVDCLDRDYLPFRDVPEHYEDFEALATGLFGPLLANRKQEAL